MSITKFSLGSCSFFLVPDKNVCKPVLANWHPNKIIGHQLFLAHPMVQLNTDFW